ncbi:MAG: hypothetical protein JWP97_3789 [Labilithrix sp.]|nr:hypothetical protein [Labilithrix sp.]
MNLARLARCGLVLGLLGGAVACSGDDGDEATDDQQDDLTSVTARSRTLEFVGTVYVEPSASDAAILATVKTQSQTAFGPLRIGNIAVNSRELKEVDPTTFVKRPVKVVDAAIANDAGKDLLEVKYTYKDNAVVGLEYARRSTAPLALMAPSYRSQLDRVLRECTSNDDEAREWISSAWYVFSPGLATCQAAMTAEQKKIDADRKLLKTPQTQVTKAEVERLYLPIQVKLGADKTNQGKSYPEYAKLYAGGVQKDKLVISLLFGNIDHVAQGGPSSDFNWGELMTTLEEVMDAGGELKQVPVAGQPAVDLSSFTLKSGKKVEKPSFKDLVGLHSGSDRLGLSYADKKDLEEQLGTRIFKKWIAVERTVSVKAGAAAARDVGIQFLVYFGAESDGAPHHFATKNSDVFLYNGHSYIGFGPLDPKNFSAADFPKTYQLLWIDGCVSYNYYEKDYIPLKQGGTKNLDLITNGIEAPAWRSGHAMGQWLNVLLNGKGASYRDLLLAASDTEALRVVDGELDNEFTPTKFPMTITPR